MEEKIKQALIKLGWVNPAGVMINLKDDELTIRCYVDGVREIKQSETQSNCNEPAVIKSVCPNCDGLGYFESDGAVINCAMCDGTGRTVL